MIKTNKDEAAKLLLISDMKQQNEPLGEESTSEQQGLNID